MRTESVPSVARLARSRPQRPLALPLIAAALLLLAADTAVAQVAVRGDLVYTMAGPPLVNGMVLVEDGKIVALGGADQIQVPEGVPLLTAAVVTPGLIDAHSVVGLSGILNFDQDQDQLERSSAMQPELRAIDAYNAREELIEWVRGFGVTTLHTGHAPGELISGQTCIVKTRGNTVDEALLVPARAVACTLGPRAEKSGDRSPGTRGKMMSMLRAEFLRAREYQARRAAADEEDDKDPPARDLRLETLVDVLEGKLPLLVTADRAQDIASALRLADEFGLKLWLDSAAEAYLLTDEIRRAGVPVIVHPTMSRTFGDRENLSYATAGRLVAAGIPVALQSGYEAYVPKTRIVLFEAALAAAHGLSREEALATITSRAAEILGIADRVGTLAVGKDGDLALYDGDPLEYTTHCIGVVIEGQVVSRTPQ